MQENVFTPNNYDVTKGRGIINSEMVFISADENLHRFLGTRAEHTTMYNIIVDKDVEHLRRKFARLDAGEVMYFITEMKRIDGCYRDVLLIIKPKKTSGLDWEYELEVMDIVNASKYIDNLENIEFRYKGMLGMYDMLFFEYMPKNRTFKVFKIENGCEVELRKFDIDKMRANEYNFEFKDGEEATYIQLCNSLLDGDRYFEYRFKNVWKSIRVEGCNGCTMQGHAFYKSVDDFYVLGNIQVLKGDSNVNYLFNSSQIDIMTGLLNKKAILDLAKRYLKEKKHKQIFLAMIDLDNFKLVNDNYGHAKGDEVIVNVATILKTVVGDRGAVGRFGGDEYFLVMYDLGGEGDLRAVLGAIATQVESLYADKFIGFNISCSMGVSEYPRNGDNYDLLFKKADRGLYLAKKKGKKRYIIYKEEMHGELDANQPEEENYFNKKGNEKIAGDTAIYNMMNNAVQNLFDNGKEAIDEIMNNIISVYGLTGISLYMGKDKKVFGRWGNYSEPMDNADYMNKTAALKRFNKKNVFWENNVQSNSFYIPEIHDKLTAHNICATIQCMIGTPEKLKGVMTFDIESTIRSWTEEDTHYFGIISQLVGKVLEQ